MVIKKLNSVFHKHSRALLLALAVLVIIPFVIGDFTSGGGCSGDPADMEAGVAFGKKVSVGELRQFANKFALLSSQANNDWETVFYQYCFVKRAEQLGITVSDGEIAEQIMQIFVKDGKYSQEIYDEFVQKNGLTDEAVAESLRLNMMIMKLQDVIGGGVTVTDAEVETFYKNANPGLELGVYILDKSKVQLPEIKGEEIKAFFDKNRDRYMTEGQLDAVIAAIPFSVFAAEAEKSITPAQIEEAKKSYPGNPDEVKKYLVQTKMSELAINKADTLLLDLFSKIKDGASLAEQLKIFRTWSADNNLTVKESGLVGFNSDKIAAPLSAELQKLPASGLQIVKEPVTDDQMVYMALLRKRVMPVRAEFVAVQKKVAEDYRNEKAVSLARRMIKEDIVKLGKLNGDAKAKFLQKFTRKSYTLPCPQEKVFSMIMDPELREISAIFTPEILAQFSPLNEELQMLVYLGNENDMAEFIKNNPEADSDMFRRYIRPHQMLRKKMAAGGIAPEMMMKKDEISGMIETEKGALFFIVEKRTPADMAGFAAQKEMLRAQLKQTKVSKLMQEFNNELREECIFTLPVGDEAE